MASHEIGNGDTTVLLHLVFQPSQPSHFINLLKFKSLVNEQNVNISEDKAVILLQCPFS